MSERRLISKSLIPIPGYEGVYYITPKGQVINRNNVILKTFSTKQGDAVELRNQGQRERLLIRDILERVGESSGE